MLPSQVRSFQAASLAQALSISVNQQPLSSVLASWLFYLTPTYKAANQELTIGRLGGLGDKVKVRNGYARNYLLPLKKAVLATKENLAKFEAERAQFEAKIAAELKAAQDRADKLNAIGKFEIAAQAGDEGKLFGSVGTRDIAEAAIKAGVDLHKSEVRLPDGVLRSVGDFDIEVQLHPDVKTTIVVSIVPEK